MKETVLAGETGKKLKGLNLTASTGPIGIKTKRQLVIMTAYTTLENGSFYHIYNHAVGGRDLFKEPDNYTRFLALYDKYIDPIAETYAWVLMPNHFHLLVRIKEKEKIGFYKKLYSNANTDRSKDSVRFQTTTDLSEFKEPERVDNTKLKRPKPSRHFSHLFNAYSRYFNIKYGYYGALFERPFKRKPVDSIEYLRNVIIYIHNNPVYHNFCEHASDYPWSSYLSCISVKSTKLQRETIMGWFDNKANFRMNHNNKIEIEKLEEWLEI